MAQPSKGHRKQIAGRLPLEVFEAFEAKRGKLGLGQNEALIVAIKLWLKPPDRITVPADAKPPKDWPRIAAKATGRIVPIDALTGKPFEARRPIPKGSRK